MAAKSVRTLRTVCLGCGELFEARRRDQLHCAARCRARAWRARRAARLLSHLTIIAHFLPPAVEDEVLGPLRAALAELVPGDPERVK